LHKTRPFEPSIDSVAALFITRYMPSITTLSSSIQICSWDESLPISCYEVDYCLCILCKIRPTPIWSCMYHNRWCQHNHYSYLILCYINYHIRYEYTSDWACCRYMISLVIVVVALNPSILYHLFFSVGRWLYPTNKSYLHQLNYNINQQWSWGYITTLLYSVWYANARV